MAPAKRPLSFSTRLLLAMIGTGAAAAALVCTLLVSIHFYGLREQTLTDLTTAVRVIATHSQAALSFGDPEAAGETLAALRVDPGIVWAALYGVNDRRFAAYSRAPATHTPPDLLDAIRRARADPSLLLVSEPVRHENRRLGTVVVAYDTSVVYARLVRDVVLSLVAGLVVVAAAVAVALRLRRYLTRPLAELVGTARHVSETDDYGARARKHTQDELGDLTDTFNAMLARIQHQSDALQHRTQEMQQLLYTVSHDLKSPLVTITGFVGILQEDLSQQQYDEVDKSLGHLARASERMGQLIDDLLDLSRIGRVAMQPATVDVTALVEEVAADLAPRLEEARATIAVQPDMPHVTADPHRMRQLFDNLLTNAIKYGLPEDGERRIEVGGERADAEIRYFVRDHGPGIPPEFRERVFALFQRLHGSAEGTGVGLTVVAKIAETHGGRAWVESTPGGGATVCVALPDPPKPTASQDI